MLAGLTVWNAPKIATYSSQQITHVLAARSFTPAVSTAIKAGALSVPRAFSLTEEFVLNVHHLALPAKIQPTVMVAKVDIIFPEPSAKFAPFHV